MVEISKSIAGFGGFRLFAFGRAAAVVGLLVVIAESEAALAFEVERGRELVAQARR